MEAVSIKIGHTVSLRNSLRCIESRMSFDDVVHLVAVSRVGFFGVMLDYGR